ncbi:multicopper oxidase-domain-containing protein [Pseudomassariella vexata]|uniref:laccase n=1 Tax=Pseudomassariella vexata TaxID=1141098 RepID=A0A1Y2E6D3_9PEZI|nr:multicopper oxidase-domain-containing protein [Pseudomassariella vexata]ORY67111.1 multicopper oxidase-domain-containing protein [Pseudomassariella vexata]
MKTPYRGALLCLPLTNALFLDSYLSGVRRLYSRQISFPTAPNFTFPIPTGTPASDPNPQPSPPPQGPPTPQATLDPEVPPGGSGGVCGGSPNGCWGRFDITTDAETAFPNTGKIVDYTFEVKNTTCAPDGVPKPCLLINNQLPGPTVFINWGDTARITVINSLQDNGQATYCHPKSRSKVLICQQDGVNGVTECPLAPGKTRVYTWQATQHGTYWYHSHHSSQYGDGVWGAIIVNGPHAAGYDVDLGPITISEVYHNVGSQGQDTITMTQGANVSIPDNILFNGTNLNFAGGGRHFQVNVQRNQRYLMRFINTGVDNFYQVGIADNHQLQVVSIDGQAIVPYTTTWVKLGVGQRVNVVVTANAGGQRGRDGSYWIRAVPQPCVFNRNDGKGNLANGIFSYTGAEADIPDGLPRSQMSPIVEGCYDEALDQVQPIPPKSVDTTAFKLTQVPVSSPFQVTSVTGGRVFRWVIGSSTMVANWEQPIISRLSQKNPNFQASDNLIEVDGSSKFAFWYVQNQSPSNSPCDSRLHMHGNTLRILASGNGTWNQDIRSLNFANPMRRDTFMLPAGGYAVMAFETSSPGAWILHCHISWHASEGLVTNALVRRKDIVVSPEQLQTIQSQCKDWTQYFETERKYNVIGSGL